MAGPQTSQRPEALARGSQAPGPAAQGRGHPEAFGFLRLHWVQRSRAWVLRGDARGFHLDEKH